MKHDHDASCEINGDTRSGSCGCEVRALEARLAEALKFSAGRALDVQMARRRAEAAEALIAEWRAEESKFLLDCIDTHVVWESTAALLRRRANELSPAAREAVLGPSGLRAASAATEAIERGKV